MKPSARPARRADLDAVLAIERGWATTPGWTRAQFEEEVDSPRARFLVLEENGQAAGFIVARVVGFEAQILDLAVRPDGARRGSGRALLGALIEAARRQGLGRATLEVSHRNAAALALYRSSGFQVVGRRPKFYNDGSDAVLMDLNF